MLPRINARTFSANLALWRARGRFPTDGQRGDGTHWEQELSIDVAGSYGVLARGGANRLASYHEAEAGCFQSAWFSGMM